MDFVCYFNLIEQQMYELQRFQQQIWQPWRDAHYLGNYFGQYHITEPIELITIRSLTVNYIFIEIIKSYANETRSMSS